MVEAFAGVVKVGYMKSEELLNKLVIKYSDDDFAFFEKKIKEYIREASYDSTQGGG